MWVSTDASVGNLKLIASVTGYTSVGQWEKYPTQKSVAIPLTSGQTYYFEVLHKEASAGDHFAVGWQLPDGTLERPISGNRIIKYPRLNYQPWGDFTSPNDGQTFVAPASVNLVEEAYDSESSITKVEFYLGPNLVGSDVTAPFEFTATNLPAGDYDATAKVYNSEGQESINYTYFYVTAPACSGTGKIQREIWRNISGTSISSVPFDTPPGNYEQLTSFETPQYKYDNYGSRIRDTSVFRKQVPIHFGSPVMITVNFG